MLNGDEAEGSSQFATADEVDGIRRTLDMFMKKQEVTNQKLQTGIGQILALINNPPVQHQTTLPEDKGSTIKGKNIQFHSVQQPLGPVYVKQFAKDPGNQLEANKMFMPQSHTFAKHNTPPEIATMTQFQTHQQHQEYNEGQAYGKVYYCEGTFDPELDWQQHPWNIGEEEEQQFQQQQIPNQPRTNGYNQHQYDRRRQPTFHNQQGQMFDQPQSYYVQMQHQHRNVAKGPKLHFPEFIGENSDGWIRKAEKYFEMVGVPVEDWVRLHSCISMGKLKFGGEELGVMQIH